MLLTFSEATVFICVCGKMYTFVYVIQSHGFGDGRLYMLHTVHSKRTCCVVNRTGGSEWSMNRQRP